MSAFDSKLFALLGLIVWAVLFFLVALVSLVTNLIVTKRKGVSLGLVIPLSLIPVVNVVFSFVLSQLVDTDVKERLEALEKANH